MTTNLHAFSDIHSHDVSKALRGDTIVSVEPGTEIEPGGTYSVGIHPWSTAEPVTLAELKKLVEDATRPEVVAVGECGLDALRGGAPDYQLDIFRFHIKLSERLGKPLIIHCVRCFDKLLQLRREMKPQQEWVVHGFRGKPELSRQLARAGISLSLGRKYNPEVPAAVAPEQLYHETDE